MSPMLYRLSYGVVKDWLLPGAACSDTMVGARGLEPPASRSRTARSTRLSYAPPAIVFD